MNLFFLFFIGFSAGLVALLSLRAIWFGGASELLIGMGPRWGVVTAAAVFGALYMAQSAFSHWAVPAGSNELEQFFGWVSVMLGFSTSGLLYLFTGYIRDYSSS